MNIAVDTQVSDSAVTYLREKGFNVIFKANREPDEVWFRDALDMGADVFVSPDWDISFLCNRYNVRWIRLKQNLRNLEIGRFIESRLKQGRFD